MGGIGEETADRILLYTCGRLAWPVDSYCLRVFSRYGILDAFPTTTREWRACAKSANLMVAEQMPKNLEDWQRLHALMQLEGQRTGMPLV